MASSRPRRTRAANELALKTDIGGSEVGKGGPSNGPGLAETNTLALALHGFCGYADLLGRLAGV